MEFIWTEDLAIGVMVIDAQHRELFKRVDALIKAIESREGAGEIEKTFVFLDDYVDSHFVSEEKAMAVYGYPEIKSHRIQHDIFRESVRDSRKRFRESGADATLMAELRFRVCDWLMSHVGLVDRELGAFLKPRLAEEEPAR